MVVPEHLDWHTDFEEYITAKQQLFAHQTSDDVAIYLADNKMSQRIAAEVSDVNYHSLRRPVPGWTATWSRLPAKRSALPTSSNCSVGI